MPDTEGNPTTPELVKALGWSPLPEDVEPAGGSEAPAPEPNATPADSPPAATAGAPAPVSSAPAPDLLGKAQADLRTQQVRSAITSAALQYKQQLMDAGESEQSAHSRAEAQAGVHWANFQREEALDQANELKKQALVAELSKAHNVPANLLSGFNDPDSMRAAAAIYGVQATKLDELAKKVATPKVPAQSFDSGQGQGGGAKAAQQLAYTTGRGPALTAAQFEQLFGYSPL